ncbi:hypothetical protein A2911_00410 [Candidatus Nomurabacteria bacterium RIFCSPLOWO2_01_FULL_40_15]|uniref:Bacterial Ig domain-containing protein n=1 Tax=Candidatus Nomurabacteria bacterium RIFCSPLOWO2_01_FULL_40_15 TaxID=1801772 RepID=A0A1F6X9A9_9BACT|nr:MAG: hypothetical protein A2911_00410 [Candidatus Nomurabacteria bacterium RIFCSPLOWO2_01_FULL_40_15]
MANFHPIKKIVIFLLLYLFLGGVVLAQAQSTENVSISARVGGEVVTTNNTSGSIGIPKTAVRFSGEAYPFATISVLKEGKKVVSVQADSRGSFSVTLEEQYDSTIVYSLFATDVSGNQSLLINYPIAVYVGFITHLYGIRFAPTIVVDKAEVRFGDYLAVYGYSLSEADLEVFIEGKEKKNFTLVSSKNGSYKIILPMQDLPKGEYVVYIRYVDDARNSKLVKFVIGELNVPNTDTVENIPGDCNYDRLINLVDFSVLAFWYGKDNPPACVDTNRDNKIDLIDFSILAFWWTG